LAAIVSALVDLRSFLAAATLQAWRLLHPIPDDDLRSRKKIVNAALEWQERFGVAPAITSSMSEFDAALLVGMTASEYAHDRQCRTAVTRGCNFTFKGRRYQVKANRPSGKPGPFVTLVGKANNYDWDLLIWILYNQRYEICEALEWAVERYRAEAGSLSRVSLTHMRNGRRLN
jgi:hypothetical protein